MRVMCLAQEHNTMSPARARTRTAQSRDKCTNHEATAPPRPLHTSYEIAVYVYIILCLFTLSSGQCVNYLNLITVDVITGHMKYI